MSNPAWLNNLTDEEIVRAFKDASDLTELKHNLIKRLGNRLNVDVSEVRIAEPLPKAIPHGSFRS